MNEDIYRKINNMITNNEYNSDLFDMCYLYGCLESLTNLYTNKLYEIILKEIHKHNTFDNILLTNILQQLSKNDIRTNILILLSFHNTIEINNNKKILNTYYELQQIVIFILFMLEDYVRVNIIRKYYDDKSLLLNVKVYGIMKTSYYNTIFNNLPLVCVFRNIEEIIPDITKYIIFNDIYNSSFLLNNLITTKNIDEKIKNKLSFCGFFRKDCDKEYLNKLLQIYFNSVLTQTYTSISYNFFCNLINYFVLFIEDDNFLDDLFKYFTPVLFSKHKIIVNNKTLTLINNLENKTLKENLLSNIVSNIS